MLYCLKKINLCTQNNNNDNSFFLPYSLKIQKKQLAFNKKNCVFKNKLLYLPEITELKKMEESFLDKKELAF